MILTRFRTLMAEAGGHAAARLLGFRVRIPPGAWMAVCFACCVLSLRRADHSSRGVLPSVICLRVMLKSEQSGELGPLRLSSH